MNIFVYSSSQEKQEQYLRIIIYTLKEQKFYANFSKCEFWLDKVSFLGHVVTRYVIQVDSKKVKAIHDWHRLVSPI